MKLRLLSPPTSAHRIEIAAPTRVPQKLVIYLWKAVYTFRQIHSWRESQLTLGDSSSNVAMCHKLGATQRAQMSAY